MNEAIKTYQGALDKAAQREFELRLRIIQLEFDLALLRINTGDYKTC